MQTRALGFRGDSDHKEFACNAGDLDSIPGWGRSPQQESADPSFFLETLFFFWLP